MRENEGRRTNYIEWVVSGKTSLFKKGISAKTQEVESKTCGHQGKGTPDGGNSKCKGLKRGFLRVFKGLQEVQVA